MLGPKCLQLLGDGSQFGDLAPKTELSSACCVASLMPTCPTTTCLLHATCCWAIACLPQVMCVGWGGCLLFVSLQCGSQNQLHGEQNWVVGCCNQSHIHIQNHLFLLLKPFLFPATTSHGFTTLQCTMNTPRLEQPQAPCYGASQCHCLNHFALYCPMEPCSKNQPN